MGGVCACVCVWGGGGEVRLGGVCVWGGLTCACVCGCVRAV